ncbi:hypothetical protein HYX11_01980 [Candidatus Woesearchaeota archaeon]|nr:hypothetical protein [Candidatus Woesearchaeota archaeon]
MMEQKLPLRNQAIKIIISELLSGTYIQENEQNPNYLLTRNNQKIYRLNVIAIIVQKEVVGTITNLLIDDGSGRIITRSFEENKTIHTLNIGDVIIIIGKLRAFNQEKYISPEIIKRIYPLWLKLRSLELKEKFSNAEYPQKENTAKETNMSLEITAQENKNNKEIIMEETIQEEPLLPFQKIIKLIKELDCGDGVLIEEIIEKSPLNKTENILEKMLQNGDIFQNNPGKVKVL